MSRLNELYELAKAGGMAAEKEMLKLLFDILTIHAEIRLRDPDEAKDVVQETCVTIREKYKTITIKSSFSGFAFGVLKNKIGNHILKKRSKRKMVDNLSLSSNPGSYPVDHDLEISLLDCLKMIRKINLRYARALNLNFNGYKTDEICRIMRIKSGNYYGILSRGRTILRKCLETGEVRV